MTAWGHTHLAIRLSTWLYVHFTPSLKMSGFFFFFMASREKIHILSLLFICPFDLITADKPNQSLPLQTLPAIHSCQEVAHDSDSFRHALPQHCFCSSDPSRPNSNAVLESLLYFLRDKVIHEWSVEWKTVGGSSLPGHGYIVRTSN